MAKDGISVITCTGGRPEALSIHHRLIECQTYKGPLQRIIIDDCFPSTAEFADTTVTFHKIKPHPKWQPGMNTLARNILAALSNVVYDKIIFIEDDDWVAPNYLEFTNELFNAASKQALALGSRTSYYYHVPTKQYRVIYNSEHASLGQTAVRRGAVETLIKICRNSNKCTSLDIRFWKTIGEQHSLLYKVDANATRSVDFVVGIKGLPGRPGIGSGHKPGFCNNRDGDGSVLRAWIGDEDAKLYETFRERKVA